jgi:glycerol-3-phosphate dehydrogenase
MKIGIIGSGIVGRTLGKAFLTEGHDVLLGTRNTKIPTPLPDLLWMQQTLAISSC